MIKIKLSLIAVALFAISAQSFAATQSANFQANAVLNASCVISASNISFGQITPATTGEANTTGTITTTCSKDIPLSFKISGGSSNNAALRTMVGADGANTDKLAYALYIDAAKTTIWGDGVPGTNTEDGEGTGVPETKTIYASLSLNQYIKPDTYTDNLTITLEY